MAAELWGGGGGAVGSRGPGMSPPLPPWDGFGSGSGSEGAGSREARGAAAAAGAH